VDLIHCFYISQTGFIGGMAAKAAQVPFVASVRGNDIHQSLFDVVEFPQIVWTLEHANALTFVAASLRDEAWRVYPFTSPAHVIWNSVDPADFETATDDEKPQYHFCHPSVGMAGELRYKKGIDRLLEACAAIDKPVEVLLIGEFNFLESVYWHGAVDQVRSAGLSVTVTGRVPHHEMLANYRSADVMAFPARHDGCPNSLLEAMLAGRACACTRTGAMGDIIDASGGGVLIEPYTPAGFQAAIQRLLYDAPLRAELGARAQHFAFTHLSPDRERAAWRNVYESLR
jgi:glycosyltransferase involved in cell wall biosynthesis